MKKYSLILLTVVILSACKKDDSKISTTETKENKVENKDSVTTVNEQEKKENIADQESALQKNEDESYTFRYNLKKGETYPFNLVISTEQSISSGGQSMTIRSTNTVVFDYFVEDVKDNQFTIRATFKRFAESSKSGNESIAYDTDLARPKDTQVAINWIIYKAVIGQNFHLIMNNKGKVVSVTGLDKIVSNVMTKVKPEFKPEEQKQIKDMLDYSLSTESIKSQFEESLNIFPDKSLKVGEKWEDNQNISEGPVKGQANVTRTFKEIKDGKATIEVKGVQNVSGSQMNPQSGISAQMKNKATLSGTVDLDFETGWIKKAKITKSESMTTVYSKDDQKETETGTQTIVTTVN